MIRFPALVAVISRVYGLSPNHVRALGEALQRARLIPVTGRGLYGRLLSPAECAPLVLAPLACSGPSAAVEATCRLARLPAFHALHGVPEAWTAVRALPADHTFGMVVEALLEDAAAVRLARDGILGFVEIRTTGPLPTVTIGPTAAARDLIEARDSGFQFLTDLIVGALYSHPCAAADAMLSEMLEAADRAHDGARPGLLSVERTISLSAIATIGEGIAYASASRAA